ncbi:MAG TPA: amidohydrolase family protein [Candidatus Dormibacteraeota bacterium]|nr:amidohydrolase family protein [Candidatus Dormibacteraeota bacterium]
MIRWKSSIYGLVLVLGLGIGLNAQPPQVTTVEAIRAGRLFDTQTGKLLTNQVVLIKGDRIEEVGPMGQVKVPADARVIDLSHATVLPGLVDAHSHIFNLLPPAARINTSREAWALLALHEAQTDLRAGFTTIREVNTHGEGYGDVAVYDAIERGLFEGPRMQITTRGIGTGPKYIGAPGSTIPATHQNVTGVDEARAATRAQIHYGADWIEIFTTGPHTFSSTGQLWVAPTFTLPEVEAIVDTAHSLHRKVSCDAFGGEGLQNCITAGVDSIEHGQGITDAQLNSMAQKGIYWDVTLYRFCMPIAVARDKALSGGKNSLCAMGKKAFREGLAKGVKITFGSGADGPYAHGTQATQFVAMVQDGMTPLQAIDASVKMDPEMMGWQNQIGSIQKGYYADMIAVTGNPLQDITELEHVKFVMKGGKVVKDDLK